MKVHISFFILLVHGSAGRIVMGLFGKTVPKTAGVIVCKDRSIDYTSFMFALLLTLNVCVLNAENFRSLCTGKQNILCFLTNLFLSDMQTFFF